MPRGILVWAWDAQTVWLEAKKGDRCCEFEPFF